MGLDTHPKPCACPLDLIILDPIHYCFPWSCVMWSSLLETRALPRAKSRALDKDTLCRGPATRALGKERPSAKTGPRQIKSLPRAEALGKDVLGKLGPLGHGGHFPSSFAEGHPLGPRQRFFIFFKILCRGPRSTALGKDFLFFFKFFAEGHGPGPRKRALGNFFWFV